MAQRLVRTLCPHCKQKVELNRAEDQDALGRAGRAVEVEAPGEASTSRSAASSAA